MIFLFKPKGPQGGVPCDMDVNLCTDYQFFAHFFLLYEIILFTRSTYRFSHDGHVQPSLYVYDEVSSEKIFGARTPKSGDRVTLEQVTKYLEACVTFDHYGTSYPTQVCCNFFFLFFF